MSVRFLQRSDTAANWVSANPILGSGEIGYVSDEHYHKVGDGVTPWNDLPEQFPDHIREGDSRLSDARTPTSHTHTLADVTDAGSAAPLDVPATGDAGTTEVVLGSDSRLTDNRDPNAHNHPWADVTGKPSEATRWPTFTEVTNKPTTYPATAHTHTLADITDAGSAAGAATTDFDAAGTASSAVTTHKSEASAHTAANVDYDNTTSGVTATTIQAAIDNVYGQLGDIGTALDTINGESV